MTATCTNELLCHPPDARLLILNADDFGMCHSVDEAIFQPREKARSALAR